MFLSFILISQSLNVVKKAFKKKIVKNIKIHEKMKKIVVFFVILWKKKI